MMLKAKDIMTRDVVTVNPAMNLKDLAQILIERKISGAVVADDSGAPVGIVTENDLITQNKRLHIPTAVRLFDAFIMLESPGRIEKEIKKISALTVGEICTRDVITVTEDTTIEEIATIMSEKKVHLLPVVEGRTVKGVIGKMDIIRGLAK